MKKAKTAPRTIDEYISVFPRNVVPILKKLRQTIQKAAPDALETISYKIPAFKWRGKYLVYFAGWKQHLAMYPVPRGDEDLRKELSLYQTGKGTVRFPLDKPLPLQLIRKMVECRMKETSEREGTKK